MCTKIYRFISWHPVLLFNLACLRFCPILNHPKIKFTITIILKVNWICDKQSLNTKYINENTCKDLFLKEFKQWIPTNEMERCTKKGHFNKFSEIKNILTLWAEWIQYSSQRGLSLAHIQHWFSFQTSKSSPESCYAPLLIQTIVPPVKKRLNIMYLKSLLFKKAYHSFVFLLSTLNHMKK